MSDVMSFTEIYGQHVELLPGRILLQTAANIDVVDDLGVDNGLTREDPTVADVDDDGPGGREDDGGFDREGGVDDDGPGGDPDDGGTDGLGGVDDDGDENGDGTP